MGVYVDPDRTLVYTVSEDKKFKVFDYERTQIISGTLFYRNVNKG